MTTTLPSWRDPSRDVEEREGHPDDAGVYVRSAPVDRWAPEGASDRIVVFVAGFRHTNRPEDDWPDEVIAENVDPGYTSQVKLPVKDARRLAAALLTAADRAEGL